MLQRQSTCERCYEKEACIVYHRALENGTAESSGFLQETFDKYTEQLSDRHLEFFRKWMRMIELEKAESGTGIQELWFKSSEARENEGKCLARMKLVSSKEVESTATTRTYQVRFERHPEPSVADIVPLNPKSVDIGEYMIISLEEQHFSLATGAVEEITPEYVTLLLRKPFHLPQGSNVDELSWRIDRDDSKLSWIRDVKTSLLNLMMTPKDFSLERHRALIIDHDCPRFIDDDVDGILRNETNLSPHVWSGNVKLPELHRAYRESGGNLPISFTLTGQSGYVNKPDDLTTSLSKMYADCNEDQRRVISHVLAAEDYVCVQGLPGTGKSTTISFIVQALAQLNASVLICAYTNSAVDNLLLKILENPEAAKRFKLWRIGNETKVHKDLREGHLLSSMTLEDLRKSQNEPRLIIGTTCLGVKSAFVQMREFDYVIVDEAGQVTVPHIISPLCRGKKFVLIGDDMQLPPLVKSVRAKNMGMADSLLKTLGEQNDGVAQVSLTIQYRMNRDIMLLANELVYKNKLRSTDEVLNRRLLLPNYNTAKDTIWRTNADEDKQWLVNLLHKDISVVFLNTDYIGYSRENRAKMHQLSLTQDSHFDRAEKTPAQVNMDIQTKHHGRIENRVEATLTEQIVCGLLSCGAEQEQIGIITPYRSQLATLENALSPYPGVERATIDRYQGRDKDCIIMSMVRSNANRDKGGLLRDLSRINVAITRAKKKLIIIGSADTLSSSNESDDGACTVLLNIMKRHNWVKDLPTSATKHFDNLRRYQKANFPRTDLTAGTWQDNSGQGDDESTRDHVSL